MKITQTRQGPASITFMVTGVPEGTTDKDLKVACDQGRYNFGGDVTRYPNTETAIVTIYKD